MMNLNMNKYKVTPHIHSANRRLGDKGYTEVQVDKIWNSIPNLSGNTTSFMEDGEAGREQEAELRQASLAPLWNGGVAGGDRS